MEDASGGMTEATPIIVCLHGMGGHSHSRYLQVWTSNRRDGDMHGMEGRSKSHPMPPHIRCHHSTPHSYSYYSPPAPPQLFTEAALKRGYRSVVYNRRGHGGTSLLPMPSSSGRDEEAADATPMAETAGISGTEVRRGLCGWRS